MTDQTDRTAVQPEGTSFTTHELLYLLSLNDTDAADVTRQHLKLGDPVEQGTQLYAAGAATLAVRGMLKQHGNDLVPRRDVQALVAILTKAEHWVELGFVGQDAGEGALLVSASRFAAMLTANTMGVFTALALESADAVAPVTGRSAKAFLDMHQPSAVSINVTHGNEKRRAVVHRGDDGRWRYATDPVGDDGNLTARDITESDVVELVTALAASNGHDHASTGTEQSDDD